MEPLDESRMGFSNNTILASPVGFRRPMVPNTKSLAPRPFIISPPKAVKKTNAEEPEPIPRMELKQFQPKEVLDFKQVKVKTSKTLYLDFFNPSVNQQTISFMKVPKPGKGFTIIGSEDQENINTVPSGQTIRIGIKFDPEKVDKVCESLLITTNEGHRLQVSLVGSSFEPPKKKVRSGPNRTATLTRNTTQTLQQSNVSQNKRQSISRHETFIREPPMFKKSPEVSRRAFHLDFVRDEQTRKLEEAKKSSACVIIQKFWRGYSTRKKVGEMLMTQSKAVRVIERAWISYKLRSEIHARIERTLMKREKESRAIKVLIQAWKCHHLRSTVDKRIKVKKEIRYSAARRIQRSWKACHLRLVLQERIQAKEVLKRESSARLIQSAWKGYLKRKAIIQQQLEQKRREAACIVIQAFWRGIIGRRVARNLRALKQKRLTSAILIQSVWRGFQTRKKFVEVMTKRYEAVCLISQSWKSYKLRVMINSRIERKRSAAVTIQSVWRGYLTRKLIKQQREHERRDAASIVIQSAWRAYLARKKLRLLINSRIEKKNAAAVKIQSTWRGYYTRKMIDQQLQERRHAACIVIQAAFRGFIGRKVVRDLRLLNERRLTSAILIQSVWRGFQTRKKFVEVMTKRYEAVCLISQSWKSYKLRVMINSRIERKRSAAVTIQSVWRGYLTRKLIKQQREHERRNTASIVIQSAWRAYLTRMVVEEIKVKRETSASIISRAWKSFKLRSMINSRIERKHSAAVMIQSAWRSYHLRKVIEHQRHERRSVAALLIQSYWRRYLARNFVYSMVLRDSQAVTVIGRAWKSYSFRRTIDNRIEMRKQKLEKSATRIQSLWRGYRTRKQIFDENERIRDARRRISEQIRNSIPQMRLGCRTSSAIEEISRHPTFSRLGQHIEALIVTSRMSQESCLTISNPIVLREVLKVFVSCNRSLVACQAVNLLVQLILNIAKYDASRANLLLVPSLLEAVIVAVNNHKQPTRIFKENVTLLTTVMYILLNEEPSFTLSVSILIDVSALPSLLTVLHQQATASRNLCLLLKQFKTKSNSRPKAVSHIRFAPYWSAANGVAQQFKSPEEGFLALVSTSKTKVIHTIIASALKELP